MVKSKVGSGPKSSNSERSADVVEKGDVYEVTSTTSSSSFQSYEFAISLELKLHDFLMHKGQKTTLLCALTIYILQNAFFLWLKIGYGIEIVFSKVTSSLYIF